MGDYIMDKSQAMLQFLQTCPEIQTNPLFFNFGNVEDNANQAIPKPSERAIQKPYIDGSILKRYTFSIDSFKSVTYIPVIQNLEDENLSDFKEVQVLIDWISQQNDLKNYPDFGNDFIIESMTTTSYTPTLLGVDTTTVPPIAIYRTTIHIDYVDTTTRLWNN